MLAKLCARLSFANVVSLMALFVALGGTSYALATGSIGSREIKNNSVRSKDIRNNAVRSRDIRNNDLTGCDVKDASLLAKDFAAGQLPAGPAGTRGPTGDPGPPGISGLEVVETTSSSTSSQILEHAASCPAGKRLIGGGGAVNGGTPDVALRRSFPSPTSATWLVQGIETDDVAANWNLFAFAICANVG
jgi:hypothetical protein